MARLKKTRLQLGNQWFALKGVQRLQREDGTPCYAMIDVVKEVISYDRDLPDALIEEAIWHECVEKLRCTDHVAYDLTEEQIDAIAELNAQVSKQIGGSFLVNPGKPKTEAKSKMKTKAKRKR